MTQRILHIIPSLGHGGAEKQLALLASGLPRDKFDVHVCCLRQAGPWEGLLREQQISVETIGQQRKYDPPAYWRLKRHIRKLRPDLVHTWLFEANSYGRKAARAAGVKRIVTSEHCIERWKQWQHFAVDRWLARRTDRLVTNSRGVRDFCVRHGISPEKFSVIPNGIEVPASDEAAISQKSSHAKLCQELDIAPETKLIAAVGRLCLQNNYKHLLWTMCLLKEVRDDFHLLIFGEGPHRARLERFGQQVQIFGQHVRLMGHRDDVARYLPLMTCLVNTSKHKGQSNAMMEAMAAGLPVVATDTPGNRDLVVSKQTGYLTLPDDRADTARWVNMLLDDATTAKQMGRAGRQRMADEFPLHKMIRRHADLYENLR